MCTYSHSWRLEKCQSILYVLLSFHFFGNDVPNFSIILLSLTIYIQAASLSCNLNTCILLLQKLTVVANPETEPDVFVIRKSHIRITDWSDSWTWSLNFGNIDWSVQGIAMWEQLGGNWNSKAGSCISVLELIRVSASDLKMVRENCCFFVMKERFVEVDF